MKRSLNLICSHEPLMTDRFDFHRRHISIRHRVIRCVEGGATVFEEYLEKYLFICNLGALGWNYRIEKGPSRFTYVDF